jgi:hypothetical protein
MWSRKEEKMFPVRNIHDRMMRSSLLAGTGFAVLLYGAFPASAQTLGTTQTFGVLGGTSVTAGGAGATVNGDVGVSPGTSITGPITVVAPFGIHNNDASAIAARADFLTLNGSLLVGACTALPSDQLNGQNLGPGCHSGGALDLASTGTLNLTGAGVYIFRAASSLTTGVGSNVALNGVDPCNVFWQVTSLATLNGTTFAGTVVAGTGVHLGVGADLTGRALAAAGGDVTMAGGNIVGGCSSGTVTGAPTLGRPAAPASVPLGSSITDVKTLAGGVSVPQGTITFNLYGPNDTTCSGAVIFTSTVAVDGNGSYSSASFTPLAIGTYRWIANYSGDANNAPTANACNAPNENVTVLAPGSGGAGIPALSGWGLMAVIALIGIAAIYRLRI